MKKLVRIKLWLFIMVFITSLLITIPGSAAPPIPGTINENRDNKQGEGAVNVIYADQIWPFGLAIEGNQRWHQDKDDVKGEAHAGENFGASVVSGDFNCDLYDDLAIGVPDEDYEGASGITSSGAVNIIYGSADGLSPFETSNHLGDQIWTQGSTGIHGIPESGDLFGFSITSGDFNGDWCDDLVIGAPGETIESSNKISAGAVNVIYGSSAGLVPVVDEGGLLIENQVWTQDTANVEGVAQSGARFGHSLTTGDFNDDGYDDLAIGSPFMSVDLYNSAGGVNILYGSSMGLRTESIYGSGREDQIFYQDFQFIEENDYFGYALTTGKFDDDQSYDLAIGVPGEDESRGMVNILYGSDYLHGNGISTSNAQAFTGQMIFYDEYPEIGDQFGFSLTSGNFGYSEHDDLAIGVPTEDYESTGYPTIIDQGVVHVYYGSISGLSTINGTVIYPFFGFTCSAHDNTLYGYSMTAGDFDPGGTNWYEDLAVGTPGSNFPGCSEPWTGIVFIHPGTDTGVNYGETWTQNVEGISGRAVAGDLFGFSLTSGDFNYDHRADLAIGVPGDIIPEVGGAAPRQR